MMSNNLGELFSGSSVMILIEMDFKHILALLLISCSFLWEAKSAEKEKSQTAAITEELIRKELERFASIQDALEAENLDITVIFSHTEKDENDTLVQHDAVQFRPISFKYNPDGPQLPDKVDEKKLKEIFEFATKLNMSAVASRETYSQDGSISKKAVYAEDIKISYDDGHSTIVITESEDQGEEDQFEGFVNMLKQYELPVVVHKTLYNDEGEILKTDSEEYKPRKVRINDGNMEIGRKLRVAEALKRAFSIKEDGKDRVTLLCKYLGIQYPKFTWQAIIGDGTHFLYSDEWVTLNLEGQTYTVVANKQ